jgi:hypothetical protein
LAQSMGVSQQLAVSTFWILAFKLGFSSPSNSSRMYVNSYMWWIEIEMIVSKKWCQLSDSAQLSVPQVKLLKSFWIKTIFVILTSICFINLRCSVFWLFYGGPYHQVVVCSIGLFLVKVNK